MGVFNSRLTATFQDTETAKQVAVKYARKMLQNGLDIL